MDCVRGISQSFGIVRTTNIGPRLISGMKLVATGLILAAPFELLLPAALLSRDVRSFFSHHWRIVRTGNAESSGRSLTDRVLETTHKCTASNKNIVSRWVVSRVVGSLGVAGASLVDTIKELALGLLTGVYAFGTGLGSIALKGKAVNPLKLKNATGRDAFNHLFDAAIHAVIIVTAPVLGLIAPSKLLLPVMVKINFSDTTKSSFLHEIAQQTRRISTRQLAFIGAGLLGLTAIGHSYGALSALKAVALPWIQNAVSFPLTRKIAATVASLITPPQNGLLQRIDRLHPMIKGSGLASVLIGGYCVLNSIAHRIGKRTPVAKFMPDEEAYIAEAEKITVTDLINQLSPIQDKNNSPPPDRLAILVDSYGQQWEFVTNLNSKKPRNDPFDLHHHINHHDRKIVVTNAQGEVIGCVKTGLLQARLPLTKAEATRLATHLKQSQNAYLLPNTFQNRLKNGRDLPDPRLGTS